MEGLRLLDRPAFSVQCHPAAAAGREVDLIVNTPYGTGGALTATRSVGRPCVAGSVPCLTTVQALAAAVQGVDALNHGDVGVRSRHEHAENPTAMRQRRPKPTGSRTAP